MGGREGQAGQADGSSLAWSGDPDEIVPHYARGAVRARARQVHEVPLVTTRVVQHDLYRVRIKPPEPPRRLHTGREPCMGQLRIGGSLVAVPGSLVRLGSTASWG